MVGDDGKLATSVHAEEEVFRAAFARVLHELRGEAGSISPKDIAEASGYATNYIYDLENRKNTPTLTSFVRIVEAAKGSPVDALRRVLELRAKFAHLQRRDDAPEVPGT